MPTRRELVADAAVTVLATEGPRGLTHRAVDRAADLPPGSTSNCFRSRAALVSAVIDRVEQLDLEVMASTLGSDPAPLSALPGQLAAVVGAMTAPEHVRATRARLALLLDESAGGAMALGHHRFLARLRDMLAEGGHPTPDASARMVSDLLDGALLHAVAVPTRQVDVDQLRAGVARLLG
ncbi:TetR/AcrR family transcriptional regulator [Nocardioides daphniae]|uniref:TetR/AcrR family transcriptional regulator n=1 Tax=Nocardioides daphniae TaxID=402297 RepID=A0A4P7UBP0_9ACTN|nr:TetR/AcrR family transcriptional regulator [Nocardioides daphniae]QCC77592.1 TetR/AcrR family transcriptional regulator [Nocardioides daphniae]GGD30439.1 hypothetical protein GCM10007231_32330 [Nocardioides daphniae]